LQRAKLNHARPVQPEAPLVSPTLVPQLPEPLPPLSSLSSSPEELGFFDRAKKHIGNKATYTEFLKLTNLFSQDLIDKHVLLDRAAAFIGNNSDLMSWFTRFLGVEIQEEVIEARIRPDPGRVNLAHCRSLGPSYRHLPKRDQTKLCKGRDAMCHQVLNDEWASHPTWASEDSGFVAHRKNQYEEGLHRLEEERHDYDFHIESCHRTIQLMEPICQQINLMNDAERANFVLARGLGGQSEAIPKRIIMKLYDRDGGAKVWQAMFDRPCAVLPIVLNRLKQKLEEWKQSQREWEKVWRDQTSKFFWKSLDHQGINAKNLDKKNFQQKTLTSEIQAKYEEGKKTREAGFGQPKHQFEFYVKDREVIHDAAHLILVALEADRSTYNSGEQEKIATFLKDFIPVFFDLDRNSFIDFMSDIYGNGPGNGDLDDGAASDEASTSKIRMSNLRKADLLRRGVLERRNGKEGSAFSGSKESTPAAAAMSDHELDDEAVPNPQQSSAGDTERKWIVHAFKGNEQPSRPYELDETYQRTVYNLYCNGNVYCFFRLFETLYSRLLAIKNNEAAVHEAVAKAVGEGGQDKAAVTLRMIDKLPKDFFQHVGPTTNYYRQIIQMCELVISGLMDLSHLEETLRRFYMQTGWQLYTIDKLLSAIIRFIMNIIGSDSKDKSLDIINLFNKDREKTATSRAQELQYRKQVEKYVKDGEMYRLSYVSAARRRCVSITNRKQDTTSTKTTIRLFPSEESTFESDTLSDDAKWQYYIASYEMSDHTEGVDLSQVRTPFLRRRLPLSKGSVEDVYAIFFGRLENEDTQTVSISPDTYKIYWEGGFNFHREVSGREKKQENDRFEGKLAKNPAWVKEESEEAVNRRMAAWMKALQDDLAGYEAAVARPAMEFGPTGDVPMSEGAV
jgi:paired amphipathic helix protein Sin3a